MDNFSNIAASYRTSADRGLTAVCPPELPPRFIQLERGADKGFVPAQRTDNEEMLRAELERQRGLYAPFLKNLAPDLPGYATRTALTEFSYSLDGGEETPVSIPHYGGPVGRHTAVYKTRFSVAFHGTQRVFLCFKGVDYIAEGAVNGRFAGRHEGFFSPFEWDVTELVTSGENNLEIRVVNDYKMQKYFDYQIRREISGDKIYASTGLGWDEPRLGWHHCPAGMGIYGGVSLEVRGDAYITALFPRVNSEASELWVECGSADLHKREVTFALSLYGQNFEQTIFENLSFSPSTTVSAGVGDTLTESRLIAAGQLGARTPLFLEGGFNRFVLPLDIPDRRVWSPDTPWLYQIQVVMYVDGAPVSSKACQFGIRDFTQRTDSEPKGKFYLNGKEIRLMGANTMGFEQQDVMRGDFDQLIDDILLAKICNMNFLRLTQRPVQEEVYETCDRLGMMIQTDMPLFGCVRINQFCEVLRQTEEMEKLVRSHPCCIIDSYINEPFPNANNIPHRMLGRDDLHRLFSAMDTVVRLHNPDRVIKYVDGDYDPPNECLPDHHCYTMWYNGHGIDMGRLHKGYWMDVKPGWHTGCGEFGAEGIDFPELMRERYPADWLTEPFDPNNVVASQTGNFHYMFYETPASMEEWTEQSQRYQALAAKIMTSALRRNRLMNTFAIHLFIDAFPSGWMKTIMDCRRRPKPAYFVYRDCLSPVWCNLRTDRFTVFAGESVGMEAYLVNDTDKPVDELCFMAEINGEIRMSQKSPVYTDMFQGRVVFQAPEVTERTAVTVYMAAMSAGQVLHYACETIEVFPAETPVPLPWISYGQYDSRRDDYDREMERGACLLIAPLVPGEYTIGGHHIAAEECSMGPRYAVSRDTGHPAVAALLRKNDMAYWYDAELDRIAPVIDTVLRGEGGIPVLSSGNPGSGRCWEKRMACGEWTVGKGGFIVCQLKLENKLGNPCAVRLNNALSEYSKGNEVYADR